MKRLNHALAVMALLGLTACKPSNDIESPTASAKPSETHDDHHTDHSVEGHAHGAGPHDGTIADWGGGKYHVEFTVDHEEQKATVYLLGGDETTATPIEADSIELAIKAPEMQVTLNAAPLESDPPGTSSRFEGTHEQLSVVQEYSGTMTGVIDGVPYSGDFDESAHGHHDH